MITPLLLLAAVSAAAQVSDLDSAFARSSQLTAAARAAAACAGAAELETSFEMTVTFADGRKPVELKFEYAGCAAEGRNDYLPPYVTRSYKAQDGYALTVITDEGKTDSEVLLSKGKDWVGRFGSLANAKLVSGDSLAVGAVELKDSVKGSAVLRDSAIPVYPQLLPCEEALKKAFGVSMRDSAGKPLTGYSSREFSLVLLTKTDAYFYHEDCDICAEITKCALQSRAITSVITAHMVSCSDMAPYAKDVVFDSCAGR